MTRNKEDEKVDEKKEDEKKEDERREEEEKRRKKRRRTRKKKAVRKAESKVRYGTEQSTKTVFILSLSKDLNFKLRQFIFSVVLLS
jgi:hypothetical protein